jgi:hypothetical protein
MYSKRPRFPCSFTARRRHAAAGAAATVACVRDARGARVVAIVVLTAERIYGVATTPRTASHALAIFAARLRTGQLPAHVRVRAGETPPPPTCRGCGPRV